MVSVIADANEFARVVQRLKLVTPEQIQDCWHALGTENADVSELIGVMQSKGYLTSFQTQRVTSGKRDEYFLGPYKLLHRVAAGSFARVFRAEHVTRGQVLALKVLRRRWTKTADSLERFRQEAEVAVTLNHPNIVKTHAVEEHDGRHFLVMDFIDGGNLASFIQSQGKVPAGPAIRIVRDVCQGLSYAFGRQITHRDIKPTNILLSAQQRGILVDFGLADVRDAADPNAKRQRTVEYAALERSTKVQRGDHRSDIFFLGCVFHEMLAGEPPFPKPVGPAKMLRRRFDDPRPLLELAPESPADIVQVIGKMMAFSPADRYQSVRDLLPDLIRLGREFPPPTAPSPAARAAPNTPAAQGPATAASAKRTILLISADPAIQTALGKRLVKLGYRVAVMRDGTRAVTCLTQSPSDCVIIDSNVAQRAPLEVLADLRRVDQEHDSTTAVILLADEEDPQLFARARALQVTDILVKPFSVRSLRLKVQQLVPLGAEDG